ncbi:MULTISPECIES: helix-turn-helix domain-containing protein [Pseudofrankia]|uniref:helix-turn-helix domain-containing protein n=1 Tax=Pseudofrankia TaxID=2994363 RepID=UPI000234BA09|nr:MULTISPECIES: helix-turn-helix transcriptional regulator [Pseudofrankia]
MTESSESPPLLRRLVGDVLRDYRMGQGRTLRDVAVAARVSVPYLSEVERGRKEASSEVLAAVCRGLDIRLSDLLEQVRRELVEREPSAESRQESRQEPSRVPVRPLAGSKAPTRPLAGAKAPAARPAAPARPVSPTVPSRLVRAADQAIPTPPSPSGPTCQLGAAYTPPARAVRPLRRRGRYGPPGGLGPRRALAPIVPAPPGRPPARAALSGRGHAARPAGLRGVVPVRVPARVVGHRVWL